ncbi:MAG: hypothetical protein ABR990_05495 [Terracidiphilus sp.]
MKKLLCSFLAIVVLLVLAPSMNARNFLDKRGKTWLDSHVNAPLINVDGNWYDKEWGQIVLNQNKDSREVTGNGDGWDITGVVSGKQLFLLFSGRGGLVYSAVLNGDGEKSLDGSYANGLMKDNTKGKSMHLIKK